MEHDEPSAAEPAPALPARTAPPITAAPGGLITSAPGLLLLQRAAGNRAAVRLLQRQAQPSATPTAEPDLSDDDYRYIADRIHQRAGWGSTARVDVWLELMKVRRHPEAVKKLEAKFTKLYGESLETFLRSGWNFTGTDLEYTLQLLSRGSATAAERITAPPSSTAEIASLADRLADALVDGDDEAVFAALYPLGRNPVLADSLATRFKACVQDRIRDKKKGWNRLKVDLEEAINDELWGSNYSYAMYLLGHQTLQESNQVAFNAARELRDEIKAAAKARAKQQTATVDKSSNFYKVLVDTYLTDYFKNPTAAEGKRAAEDKIGHQLQGTVKKEKVDGVDTDVVYVTPEGGAERRAANYWERYSITQFNKEKKPDLPDEVKKNPLFKGFAALPAEMGAATEILSVEKTQRLPYIDVPFLIGKPNTDISSVTADVIGGGKNISQLMHWATGVKYSDQPADSMRDLFIGYEKWHLEAWDIFGQDPINDLIAEEQGRLFGAELRKGSAGAIKTEADLVGFLNSSFREARAWVGKMLKLRETVLDDFVLSVEQKPTPFHWRDDDKSQVWASPTLYQMLAGAMSKAEVRKTEFFDSLIEIYTLIYEADEWESAHAEIKLTQLQQKLVKGDLDPILKYLGEGEKASSSEKAAAGSAAKGLE